MKFYTDVTPSGDSFLVRGWEDGKRFMDKVPFSPRLYVPSQTETPYHNLKGSPLKPMEFTDTKEMREFINRYKDVPSFEIFGNEKTLYQFIGDFFPEPELERDLSLIRVGYIDIETESEFGFPNTKDPQERINVITVILNTDAYVFALGKVSEESLSGFTEKIHLSCFDTEEELLQDFLRKWVDLDLDIITGWNIEFFDIPYIVARVRKVLGNQWANRLSPWKHIRDTESTVNDKKSTGYVLTGLVVVDYMDLYKHFTALQQESFRLDYIAHVELGEKKTDWTEFENIREFYKRDFPKFVLYNVQDTVLVRKLNDKLRNMDLLLTLAYDAKVNFLDIFLQVRTWDAIIYNYLKNRNIFTKLQNTTAKFGQYAGAYVKDPIIGLHDWVVSFDINSLYPHLIIQNNLSPETIVEDDEVPADLRPIHGRPIIEELIARKIDTSMLKNHNMALAANGHLFRRDKQGFLGVLMEKLYKERVENKKKAVEARKQLERVKDEIKRRGL